MGVAANSLFCVYLVLRHFGMEWAWSVFVCRSPRFVLRFSKNDKLMMPRLPLGTPTFDLMSGTRSLIFSISSDFLRFI